MTSRQHSYSYLRHGGSKRSLSNLFGDDHSTTTNNNVNSTATLEEVQTFQSQSPLTDESAPWSTRKTILLTEALVITAIVIPLVFCFFYHRASKTETSSSLRSHVAATANTATNNNNNLGTASRANNTALALDATTDEFHDHQHDRQAAAVDQAAAVPTSALRRTMQTLVSLPSTLLSVLLYPIRLIDEGVNSWSTANADITFLRSVMERLEEERLAQLEDVEERGERLKMAFSRGKMVWEIGEEHFTPPPINVENNIDGTDHTTASSSYVGNSFHKLQLQREVVEEEIKGGGREDEVALVGERKEEHNEGVVEDVVEQKQHLLDDNNCDDEHHVMTATTTILSDVEEANDGKGGEAKQEGEGVDNTGEDGKQSSSLMTMDETKSEQSNQSSLPMSNEGEGIIVTEPPLTKNTAKCSTLFDNPPPRSMSPLEEVLIPDDGLGAAATTPAYLFLSHRRNRANTNETNSSTIPSLASSSSLSHHNLPLSQSSESFVSANSANDNIPSVEEEGEEELKSVPNNCAICLDTYVSGDTIVTSCNPLCPHAFHQECIIEWLVKMQEGTPCPCCRRTFVELSPSRPATTTANGAIPRQTTSPEQEEQRRLELQRTIELGIRRGRAFDISVISLR